MPGCFIAKSSTELTTKKREKIYINITPGARKAFHRMVSDILWSPNMRLGQYSCKLLLQMRPQTKMLLKARIVYCENNQQKTQEQTLMSLFEHDDWEVNKLHSMQLPRYTVTQKSALKKKTLISRFIQRNTFHNVFSSFISFSISNKEGGTKTTS